MNLNKLGYNEHIKEKFEASDLIDYTPARVISVDKDRYIIHDGKNEISAEITGKLKYSADTPLDYPAVGDWVKTEIYDQGSLAIIQEVIPRTSMLKRKTPGKKVDFQVIAANIDTAFIVQSLDENYNLRRLERYLVMINDAKIHPEVLLSKSDLVSEEELQAKIEDIYKINPGLTVSAFNNIEEDGHSCLINLIEEGKTYCLLGSSGVGKTTLLNRLLGEDVFETAEVREKDSRGRHTTSRRQMTILHTGGLIIDTPGMRELGNIGVEEGIEETFDEISEAAKNCRFSDCTHTNEKGCAVQEALNAGDILEERYGNYIKMVKESKHNEMSYLDRRRKDKEFGKMIKHVMKNNRKK